MKSAIRVFGAALLLAGLAACQGGSVMNLIKSGAGVKARMQVSSPNGAIGSGAYYDFSGQTAVGQTLDAVFTVSNPGAGTFSLDPVSLSNAQDFSCDHSGYTDTIGPNENHNVVFTFKPTAAETIECLVTLTTKDADPSSFSFHIRGNGKVSPQLLAPPSWIQGVWWQAGGTPSTHNEYAFTSDNVVNTFVSSGITVSTYDFKYYNQMYAANGMANTGYYDSEPNSTTYLVESRSSGSIVGAYTFVQQTSTSLAFTITGTGGGGPWTFNKQ